MLRGQSSLMEVSQKIMCMRSLFYRESVWVWPKPPLLMVVCMVYIMNSVGIPVNGTIDQRQLTYSLHRQRVFHNRMAKMMTGHEVNSDGCSWNSQAARCNTNPLCILSATTLAGNCVGCRDDTLWMRSSPKRRWS